MRTRHEHHRGGRGWLGLALAGLLALAWADLRSCHRRRGLERSAAKPEPLQTWEGEGGGLPALVGNHGRRKASAAAADNNGVGELYAPR